MARIAFFLLALLACAGFTALAIWQLQRLVWKRDLIAQVEARVHAEPAAPLARSEWPHLSAERDAYRRIRLQGRYLGGPDTRVQAVTRLGTGWWLLRPFLTNDGNMVLVNRGFVPDTSVGEIVEPPADAPTIVIGLLRTDEPGGGFLRRNDPAESRWYSRDTQAIARSRGLSGVAPFFIDAEQVDTRPQWPVGGLTVTRFPNNHLPYALTWFTLAGLAASGAWRLLHDHRRQQTRRGGSFDAAARHGVPG